MSSEVSGALSTALEKPKERLIHTLVVHITASQMPNGTGSQNRRAQKNLELRVLPRQPKLQRIRGARQKSKVKEVLAQSAEVE